ncbi:MAG: tRNA lysidine(34) synthetase TilS, partial [Nitrospirae bacterium]|nr:tRNA lysidine(34) synthetase TilS [Nitrospirota bacterium]
ELAIKEASILIRCTLPDTPGEKETFDYGDGKKTAAIDADKVQFPLQIRPRLSGDYFYPLGFGKRKKLQDYFVDEKIPRDVRDSIPLLVSNNDIVWIVGHRLDERYRIDKNTKRILKFEVKPLKF